MTADTVQQHLDAEIKYAPAWRGKPGDSLIGVVTARGKHDAGRGVYEILTVRQADGQELAWHGYHTVAAAVIAEEDPQVGQEVGIKFLGLIESETAQKPYYSYKLYVERGHGEKPDPASPSPATTDDDVPY